jgi:hypothetical protein
MPKRPALNSEANKLKQARTDLAHKVSCQEIFKITLKPKQGANSKVTAPLKPSKIKRIKISKTSLGWYHDLDPYTLHKTRREAQLDRNRIKNITPTDHAVVKSRKPRVPTFYTYMQDKRKSLLVSSAKVKFHSVPQGPHVIPHHGLHQGLVIARQEKNYDVFNHLIPKPEDYNKLVDDEIGANHDKGSRAVIVKSVYERLYKRKSSLEFEVYKNELVNVKYFHTVNRLLHLHPYGTYGYKGNGAGKKALQGKGERNNGPIRIDTPPQNSYKNWHAADEYHNLLVKTLNSLFRINEQPLDTLIGGNCDKPPVKRRSSRVAVNSTQKRIRFS